MGKRLAMGERIQYATHRSPATLDKGNKQDMTPRTPYDLTRLIAQAERLAAEAARCGDEKKYESMVKLANGYKEQLK